MRALTLEEARRRLLGAQGLSLAFETPHEAMRACFAVQTQYAISLPVAMASRVQRLRAHWDEAALSVDGWIVKSWSLRQTLHAHTREDHALALSALGGKFYSKFAQRQFVMPDLEATEAAILEALSECPLSRPELHERVPALKSIPFVGWGMDVMGLAFKGRIAMVGRGAEQRFARLHVDCSRERALEALLLRYLEAYGPATVRDFAYWTGLGVTQVREAFRALEDAIEPVLVEGLAGTRYVVRRASSSPDLPGVRLLAKFDPLVMAHHDKRLVMREEDRPAVFRKAGQVEATVLVGGVVAATWRLAQSASALTVTIEPIRTLRKRELMGIEREAERLRKAFGKREVSVEYRD